MSNSYRAPQTDRKHDSPNKHYRAGDPTSYRMTDSVMINNFTN
jgi:hypothetical protein